MGISLKNFCFLLIVMMTLWALPVSASTWQIPDRGNPRPETTAGIPHIQIDVEAVPELSEALLQRVSGNATLAVEKGWAIHHPWANTKPGLRGFVMIYTPLSEAELEVVFKLVMASYRFVAGIESSSAK
jgi:hypothetical protein